MRSAQRHTAFRSRGTALILAFLLLSVASPVLAQQRFTFEKTPLREVLREIARTTEYHFLYRDALIRGKTVSFTATPATVLERLDGALRPLGIQLRVDEVRRQVLLSPLQKDDEPGADAEVLSGRVVDGEIGIPLPYATVTWRDDDGHLRGVAADDAGTFRLPLGEAQTAPGLELTASYVGYQSYRLHLTGPAWPEALTFRLVPEPLYGREVLVSSTVLHTELDTTWHHLLSPERYAPLGEGSVIRSLQVLPAVSVAPALAEGLNVRGSRSDGFQVLLDGVSIYNQHHLYGLFDAFNEDALQRVGFYYGVSPANLQAPPGGTLAFVTRTGSPTHHRQSLGLSNTAFHATAEGPLAGGRGSWLLSGRRSYLDAVDWFNNGDLVAQGLDVARETSAPDFIEDRLQALFPGTASAAFFDLHGKLYLDASGGTQWTLNGYLGGDRTRYDGEGLIAPPKADTEVVDQRRPVVTESDWGNGAASLHVRRPLGHRGYTHTLVGISRYDNRFSKDDFLYLLPQRPSDPPSTLEERTRLSSFAHDNDLTEWTMTQQAGWALPEGGAVSGGISLHHYQTRYREASILRSDYDHRRSSSRMDLFGEYEGRMGQSLNLRLGMRSHYFGEGDFLRFSPRLWVRAFEQRPVSFSFGYSRNHQFLHRLYLENLPSADVWALSTADEPPGRVDHLTAGVYLKPTATLFFQAEVYDKRFENLRLHETTATRRNLKQGSLLLAPWLHDNEGHARGLEVMLRQRLGPLLWTNGYTYSRMELRNDVLNGGNPFRADWDRTHQFTTHLQGAFSDHVGWELAWLYASGTPNTLAYARPAEPDVLGPYHRLDLSLHLRRTFGSTLFEARAAVFNLYDRDNPWYRKPFPVLNPRANDVRLRYISVDVYDLGIQPSFEFSLSF